MVVQMAEVRLDDLGALRHKSLHGGHLVVVFRLALFDADGTRWAVADAGTQSVAIQFADQMSLAVDQLQGTFVAALGALAAAVAQFLVDGNDVSFHDNCVF